MNINEILAPFCSYQEKFILDNNLNSIFLIHYHEDTPSWGGVRRVSLSQDSLHPIENPFRSGTQRREMPIAPQYTLTIYYCLSKFFDLKLCVTNRMICLIPWRLDIRHNYYGTNQIYKAISLLFLAVLC